MAPLVKRIDAKPSPISDGRKIRHIRGMADPSDFLVLTLPGPGQYLAQIRPGTQCDQFHDLRPLGQMLGEQIGRLAAPHQWARGDPSRPNFGVRQAIEHLGESLLAVGGQRPQIVVRIAVFIVLFGPGMSNDVEDHAALAYGLMDRRCAAAYTPQPLAMLA